MDTCKSCGLSIRSSYHRFGSHMICGPCREAIEAKAAETKPSDLPKGIVFALAAACVGAFLRSGFELLMLAAGGSASFLSMSLRGAVFLAVTGLIAGAAARGSRGKGGLPLQIMTVLFLYLALTLSLVPVIMVRSPNLPRTIGMVLSVSIVSLAIPFTSIVRDPVNITGLIMILFCLAVAWQATARKYPSIDGPFEATLSEADRRLVKL